MPTRRATLLLPALILGCAKETPAPLPPLDWSHLLRIDLKVAELEIDANDPPPAANDIGRQLVVRPAEAVRMMGRDRLGHVGTRGIGLFSVTRATLQPERSGLLCTLGCRLEVAADDVGRGFIEAEARATVSDAGSGSARIAAAERLLRQTMERLNVEFEYQLRSRLRDWIATAGAPTRPEVQTEELPKG